MEAGTGIHPFDQKEMAKLVHHIKGMIPDISWRLFDHFPNQFRAKEGWGHEKVENYASDGSHTSSVFMSFELDKIVAMKACFVPVNAEQPEQTRLTHIIDNLGHLGLELPLYNRLLTFSNLSARPVKACAQT